MQQVAVLVWPASATTAAPDVVLQRRMLPSDDAAATRTELGLKHTLVMGDVWPDKQAILVWVCTSHRQSERSDEPAKKQ
jgi:hypothetical protein